MKQNTPRFPDKRKIFHDSFSKRTLVTKEPVFGWGNGSQESCSDKNGCPSHEDPHLWIDERGGFHLLTHDQNNPDVQAGFDHVNKQRNMFLFIIE